MSRLKDKVALVTGASRGIGAATALALAKEGAHIIATARTTGGLEELDDQIKAVGGSATLVPLNITDTPGVERLALALGERYGRLDILVGNAGVLGHTSPLPHIETKIWDQTVAINLTANWHLIRTMDGLLRAAPAARAVFISSGAASKARAYWGAYAVTKAGLEVLARTYAAETETTHVKVNLFNPGPIRTKMRAAAMPGEDPSVLDTPEQVAEFIVAMCLPDVDYSGKLFDYPTRSVMKYNAPSE
ncbi:putative oxidoreductase YciK [Variibacter gotjawalensis]|uniref:Putative oxidoreductase YciK n=1 Tax=Variibacter gotjawalensis TaxID=1333996 RepID=A0A0S3PXA4_9BRAD|nr:SDR family NAD(P)-dependent oxidoreductase [Variibacter gotjawalensis]NIK46385.1 NAD(P)-dependent dehydrogenase (short-subunit alcohol dehydrogenase family) [Variibacter gotjawalensis]RZS48295.1 NAD(P)-dependent dehydrogenase (short-subunit alcohol dehydrogenase family) [Variibacter gotjawalensis]BAT60555.1 putative oxidoreductase YciK [Variibacter gotjawalensis]